MRPCLYISELAAFIGQHKWQPQSKAWVRAWKRMYPEHYASAVKRTNSIVRNDEETVQAFNIEIETSVAASSEQEATQQVEKVLDQPLLSKTQIQQIQTVLESTDTQTVSNESTIKKEIQNIIGVSDLTLQIEQLVQKPEKVIEVCTGIKRSHSQQVEIQVKSFVSKARGTKHESGAIQLYEHAHQHKVHHNNDKFYSKEIEGTTSRAKDVQSKVLIGGRIDGINSKGQLVEIKCRRNRIFRWIPQYEQIQIQAYMYVTGLEECEFVQKYNSEIKKETIPFESILWKQLEQDIIQSWNQFQEMMQDESLQDELIETERVC